MFNRRQFVKASMAASAASAFPSIWWRARQASALEPCETGVNLVIVQLEGGNDGVNTVIPMSNGTGMNYSTYTTLRPYIGIPVSELGPTQVGNDPLHSGQLALHPHMVGLKSLYNSGNLAVILGVHSLDTSLSHEIAELIWYRADPALTVGTGWMGRTIGQLCAGQQAAVAAVDTQSELTPLFAGPNASVLAFDDLGDLGFPVQDTFGSMETGDYKAAFGTIHNNAATTGTTMIQAIGAAGAATVAKVDAYATANEDLAVNLNDLINGDANGSGGFGVVGFPQRFELARGLRTVFALMKGAQPGNVPLGCRIFRVRIGGFDSHSEQGNHIPLATKSIAEKVMDNNDFGELEFHGRLMHRVSSAISAFWQDCVDDGALYKNTVIMTFSEFGRRIEENGNANQNSGTDHGTAAPMFVIGPNAVQSLGPTHVVGGMYGAYPELDQPDDDGNLVIQLDFRDFYAEIINRWLGLSAPTTQSILNGWSYTPQGFLVP